MNFKSALCLILIFLLPLVSSGQECLSLLGYLAVSKGVRLVPKKTLKNETSFTYHDIPNTPYIVAISRENSLKVSISKDGTKFEVANPVYTYGATFKNGECVNTYAFEDPQRTYGDRSRVFNYDWKTCTELVNLFDKDRLSRTRKNVPTYSRSGLPFEKMAEVSQREDQERKAYWNKEFKQVPSNTLFKMKMSLMLLMQPPQSIKDHRPLNEIFQLCLGQLDMLNENAEFKKQIPQTTATGMH